MKNITRTEQIRKFIIRSGVSVYKAPPFTDKTSKRRAISLIFEELKELANAINEEDHFNSLCSEGIQKTIESGAQEQTRDALDALCDIAYTTYNAVNVLGLHPVFEEAFDEVCESNLSKFERADDEESIKKTRDYFEKNKIPYYTEFIDTEDHGEVVVFKRKKDGKIIKPYNYKAPKLSGYAEFILKQK